MLKFEDIERAAILHWDSLPETKRQTIEQASLFADEIAKRNTSAKVREIYRLVLGLIADYQININRALKLT